MATFHDVAPGRRAAGAGDPLRALRPRGERERPWYGPAGEDPGVVESYKPPEPPSLDALEFPMHAFAGAEITGHGWDAAGVHSVTISQDGGRDRDRGAAARVR